MMKHRFRSIDLVLCIGFLSSCGQPDSSYSNNTSPRVVETVEHQGDVNGVIIQNIYPEPQNGTIQEYSVTIGPEQAVVVTPEPMPVGPDYIESVESVTILVDHYWRRYSGDIVPVTMKQQIITMQSAYPQSYDIRPVYNETELELIRSDTQTATWIFKPKMTGTIVLRMRKTFLCGGDPCENMPITTIPIELNVSP